MSEVTIQLTEDDPGVRISAPVPQDELDAWAERIRADPKSQEGLVVPEGWGVRLARRRRGVAASKPDQGQP